MARTLPAAPYSTSRCRGCNGQKQSPVLFPAPADIARWRPQSVLGFAAMNQYCCRRHGCQVSAAATRDRPQLPHQVCLPFAAACPSRYRPRRFAIRRIIWPDRQRWLPRCADKFSVTRPGASMRPSRMASVRWRAGRRPRLPHIVRHPASAGQVRSRLLHRLA